MRHRDISWTVALCLSLGIHAAIIRWRAEAYVAANNPLWLPGLNRVLIVQDNPPTPTPPPDIEQTLGDDKGTGYATDASPGDLELMARKGDQDQSFLSRDPQSLGQAGATPRNSPPGENGANGSRSAEQTASAQSSNHPFGIQQQSQPPAPAFKAPPDPARGPAPAPHPNTPPAQTAVAAQSSASPAVTMTAYQAPTGRPGAVAAASPAPQAESDSDPFAVVGSLEFRPGSTKVQCGRKHRITRPRLSWDTVYDFQEMMSATVVLELQLDETGQVVSAIVVQSSGSNSIDQPCRLAAYSWWFEPAKDATGKPVRDVIKFTIKFF